MACSQQDSELNIFGSGFSNYGHWGKLERFGGWEDVDGLAPDGWIWKVESLHPTRDARITTFVTHNVLMGVMSAIYNFKLPWGAKVSGSTFEAVKDFLMNPETSTEFDAESADEVMQIAAYGRLTF
ncbi:hypothetical protein [Streptomyces sp. NPDC047990]|uniref:hypothetical protein n=1 Tax=Streptomyces sp. NPDC047990 TaxID=3365496 RepID=UPI00371D2023